MNNLQKQKIWTSKKYRDYIKTLDCVATGRPADDAHHITGLKESGIGTKIDDFYCIPLTREQHTLLHNDFKKWEASYGPQLEHWRRTIAKAIRDGELEPFDRLVDGL